MEKRVVPASSSNHGARITYHASCATLPRTSLISRFRSSVSNARRFPPDSQLLALTRGHPRLFAVTKGFEKMEGTQGMVLPSIQLSTINFLLAPQNPQHFKADQRSSKIILSLSTILSQPSTSSHAGLVKVFSSHFAQSRPWP